MERLHHFFECLLPTTQCNLQCEYCYLIQEKRRTLEQISFDYDVDYMIAALSKERVGGTCFFSICGTGETLLQKDVVPLVEGLLKEGHYVNITTNGTITPKIRELADLGATLLDHLQFAFSFHYLELKRLHLLETFSDNVNMVRKAGCSIVVQLNLYDGYIPYLDDIKSFCLEHFEALPQVAATRWEHEGNVNNNVDLYTHQKTEEYKSLGDSFYSELFSFTMKNFNVKRCEFCYAGAWSSNLLLKDGTLKPCYESGHWSNVFKDISKPIYYRPVGKCNSLYCINSSHFISLGVIPDYSDAPTYVDLRDRPEANWYKGAVKAFLSQKLSDNNRKLTQKEEHRIQKWETVYNFLGFVRRKIRTIGSKIKHIIIQ